MGKKPCNRPIYIPKFAYENLSAAQTIRALVVMVEEYMKIKYSLKAWIFMWLAIKIKALT
jgi:hypothetical protein